MDSSGTGKNMQEAKITICLCYSDLQGSLRMIVELTMADSSSATIR